MSTLRLSTKDYKLISWIIEGSDKEIAIYDPKSHVVSIDVKKIEVADAIKIKNILEKGGIDHSMIKIELFILGAGMQGFSGAIFVSLINALGWGKSFSNIWATSSGAHSATYLADGAMSYITGKTFKGACIYPEVLARNKFMDISRVFSGDIVDLRLLERSFRVGSRNLNEDNVTKFPISINIAVADYETGEGEIIHVNASSVEGGVIDWAIASSSIPGVSPPKVVCGKRWLDGNLNSIFKLFLENVSDFNFTHVLVVPSSAEVEEGKIVESKKGK